MCVCFVDISVGVGISVDVGRCCDPELSRFEDLPEGIQVSLRSPSQSVKCECICEY